MTDKTKLGVVPYGVFHVVHRGPDGEIKSEETCRNLVTNEGLDYLLELLVGDEAIPTNVFVVLTQTSGAPAAGWNYDNGGTGGGTWEEFVGYSEGVRQTWTDGGSVSGQSIDNSGSPAVFSINATGTIYGAGITTNSTKGDHAAGVGKVLYCMTQFGSSKSVDNGDSLTVTITLTTAVV